MTEMGIITTAPAIIEHDIVKSKCCIALKCHFVMNLIHGVLYSFLYMIIYVTYNLYYVGLNRFYFFYHTT